MNPKELIEASRDLITDLQDEPSKYVGQAQECISQLLARIEELETSLDEAEALTKRNVELINGYLTRIAELEAQITALKRIAVEERARYLEDFIHEFDPSEDRTTEARRQLAEEHPEAFR